MYIFSFFWTHNSSVWNFWGDLGNISVECIYGDLTSKEAGNQQADLKHIPTCHATIATQHRDFPIIPSSLSGRDHANSYKVGSGWGTCYVIFELEQIIRDSYTKSSLKWGCFHSFFVEFCFQLNRPWRRPGMRVAEIIWKVLKKLWIELWKVTRCWIFVG